MTKYEFFGAKLNDLKAIYVLASHCTKLNFSVSSNCCSIIRNDFLNSTDVPDPCWVIHEKIRYAFFCVSSSHLNGLIQFWAPVKTGGRWLLTTSNQPFAVEDGDFSLDEYRLCCMRYYYSIDVPDDPTIISDTPTNAFLEKLPKVVLNLRVHQGNSLVRSALECKLTTSLMLPVFYHSQRCVGTVECSMKQSRQLPVLFYELKSALERVGLNTFHVQECQPYKDLEMHRFVFPALDEEELKNLVKESKHVNGAIENERAQPTLGIGQPSTKHKRNRVNITRQQLMGQFGKSVADAAKELGVCTSLHVQGMQGVWYTTMDRSRR